MLEYAHITADKNDGAKSLPATSCSLGIGGKPQTEAGDSGANLDFIQIN